jgi:hypothetical protein
MHPDEAQVKQAEECWRRFARWPDGKPFEYAWDDYDDVGNADGMNQWRAEVRRKLAECKAPVAPTSILKTWEAELASSDAMYSFSRIFLPPIALLITGCIFGWIVNGFRTSV